METGEIVVAVMLGLVALTAQCLAGYCVFLISKRDGSSFVETALRFNKAGNVEEAVRAGALAKSLDNVIEQEIDIPASPVFSASPAKKFARDLLRAGHAKSDDGTEFDMP